MLLSNKITPNMWNYGKNLTMFFKKGIIKNNLKLGADEAMEQLGLNEIRERFLRFFESKGHLRLPSFPLVPQNDSSLLLINAGMAPLKPFFTGKEVPPRKRVTTCQKCIRTPDIERVGKTARHGTFFEMLGNFSFGDYFKSEATAWAWEFVTKEMKMPVDRLWVTIYQDDDEAFDIWTKQVGVDPARVVRMGKEDNFWEIGTGPCGPCSEIYFDRGEQYGCDSPDCKVGCECDRYVEFWNLVFTQFDKDEQGEYHPLAHPNIDTGMGLERIAAIMQGVDNLFEVDTIQNVMKHICQIAKVDYNKEEKTDVSLRVITDHIRGTVFMICDGVLPSNEGRGYVLRRLLRRAARHGKLLGIDKPFLYQIVETVVKESQSGYPELVQKQDYIEKIVKLEEERFDETIDQGLSILNDYLKEAKQEGKSVLAGEKVFKLYDTFGFPLDLTREIAEEKGLAIDEEAYQKEMEAQRERAREARGDMETAGWKEDTLTQLAKPLETEFLGYESLSGQGRVTLLFADGQAHDTISGGQFVLMADQTVFYGESGGQVGDQGTMSGSSCEIQVMDCKKQNGKYLHTCKLTSGVVHVGDLLDMKVDEKRRMNIARNHSATHLLQAALKQVLGNHVAQAGSLVMPDKLRFDFSHFTAMTPDEIAKTEELVNQMILDSLPVTIQEMKLEDAKKTGATALFGEKYGEVVRVVRMGDKSTEFCGGCHLRNTSQAALFQIVSEGGVAAGVRRIEAITGQAVLQRLTALKSFENQVSAVLKTSSGEAVAKILDLSDQLKHLKKENETLQSKLARGSISTVIDKAQEVNGVRLITHRMKGDMNSLRQYADLLRDHLSGEYVIVLAAENERVNFMVCAAKSAVDRGVHAGKLVKEIAAVAGGSGGGKPDSAQAGAKHPEKIEEALGAAQRLLSQQLS